MTHTNDHQGHQSSNRMSKGQPDPGVEAAMRRATIKARRRAIALTGQVVTVKDGKVAYETEP